MLYSIPVPVKIPKPGKVKKAKKPTPKL